MTDIAIFLLGGYVIPMIWTALQVAFSEIETGDATGAEILVTAGLAGVLWPFAEHRAAE